MDLAYNIGMAIGPVIGYIYQYVLIEQIKSVGSFSIDVCLILLFANIMRVNFYVFNQYHIALLCQSLIMITMQILLLRVCNKYTEFEEGESQQFWRWKKFSNYRIIWLIVVKTIIAFTVSTLIVSFFFESLHFSVYGQLIGLVALLSESILILPQIVQIFRKLNAKGISQMLLFLNLTGDIFKLIYFFINNQPFQFKLCGVIQIALDSFIILQIIYFKKLRPAATDKELAVVSGTSEKLQTDTPKTTNQQKSDGQAVEPGLPQEKQSSKLLQVINHEELKNYEIFQDSDPQEPHAIEVQMHA